MRISSLTKYSISLLSLVLLTASLLWFGGHVNATSVALAFLLLILTTATFFGRNPALLISVLAMLAFNYFFLPPVGTWRIADPENLVAWAAFTLAAIITGELSAYARRRATESQRLYAELQEAFEASARAEAYERGEKLKSALLDAVTHDLQTPLTSIKASVTALLDSESGQRTIELTPDGRLEFLTIINEETDRLNRFIGGMVALAKVESGGMSNSTTHAGIEEIVQAAVERAEKLLTENRLKVDLEPELPLAAVDARAISEVIFNLLDNAVKYSPAGTTIAITARKRGSTAVVTISDEGIGIPESEREHVFEKFVRLRPGAGMGLGLSIAKAIVEAQKGSITIEAGPGGKGTTVIIEIPLETNGRQQEDIGR